MKRELGEHEIEVIKYAKANDGKILGKEQKSFGYDILTSRFYYINKFKTKNNIDFIANRNSFYKIVEEQFSFNREVMVDDVFFNAFCNNLKGKRVIFNPNKPEQFEDFGGDKFYNLFSTDTSLLGMRDMINSKIEKGELERIKKGDLSFLDKIPFTKILLKNITNNQEEHIEYLINWLSSILNTRMKIMTAIAFIGSVQGTGKGTFETIYLDKIFGDMKVTLTNKHLESRFNGILENKMFVVLNEIEANLHESSRVSEDLKMLVSDEELLIERKGIDSIRTQNFFNILLFSNKNLPIKLEQYDRRWTIFNTSTVSLDSIADELGMGILDFIEKCREEVNNFCYYVTLYDFDIRAAKRVLNTEMKQTIVESTTTKLEIVCKKVLSKDFEWLKDKLLEQKERDLFFCEITDDFIESIAVDFSKNRIENKKMEIIYRSLIDNIDFSTIKMSAKLQIFLGKTKSSNGIRFYNLNINNIDLSKIKNDFFNKKEIDSIFKEDKLVEKNILENINKNKVVDKKEVNIFDFYKLAKKHLKEDPKDLFFITDKKTIDSIIYSLNFEGVKYFTEVLTDNFLTEEEINTKKLIEDIVIPF